MCGIFGQWRFDGHVLDMIERDAELSLWEHPIVMNGMLKQHRQLTSAQGKQRILELAQRCRQVEGAFTLLWHNSSLEERWQPWAKMYRRAVKLLAEMSIGSSAYLSGGYKQRYGSL